MGTRNRQPDNKKCWLDNRVEGKTRANRIQEENKKRGFQEKQRLHQLSYNEYSMESAIQCTEKRHMTTITQANYKETKTNKRYYGESDRHRLQRTPIK